MSNFERKFENWKQKMQQKTEDEKHSFALTVSFLLSGIVLFFVVSGWYYQLSGESLKSSFLTDLQEVFQQQKIGFYASYENFNKQKEDLLNTVSNAQDLFENSQTVNVSTTSTTSLRQNYVEKR